MSIYGNSMLATLRRDCGGEFIALNTCARWDGRHGRFLIDADRLGKWLASNTGDEFFDSDCGNWLRITPAGTVWLCWVSSVGGNKGMCLTQTFRVGRTALKQLITGEQESLRLFVPENRSSRARIELAQSAHIPQNPHMRRAFSKALARAFGWKGATITLCPDGAQDYYFVETCENGRRGICGGLVYSSYPRRGHIYNAYNVHT